MVPPHVSKPINGYIELASPQLLDDYWRDLNFDLASSHNVLQDLITPESGSGYVYRDAKLVGSPMHNRFLYWRAANEMIELVEVSTEVMLDGNQVRIRFANSPIINNVTIMEFPDSVVIMIATSKSVHRLQLPHPKITNNSILQDLTTELLFNPANYYILCNQGSASSQQPICASSWFDRALHKCALSYPDSSLLIVQFSRDVHLISTCEIKQIGIIGRLWSRMPNLLARNPNDCDNAVFVSAPFILPEAGDVLLFTLCRDLKIRVFSTNSRECVLTYNIIPQSSFSQSYTSHTNATTELPMLKTAGSHVVVYYTENRPEFILLNYSYEEGSHSLRELSTIQTPNWETLIDFAVTENKIWALANIRETESTLCHLDLKSVLEGSEVEPSEVEGVWDFVNLADDLDMPSVNNYVTEIFWRNHFSVETVRKALTGIAGPSVPKKTTMKELEEIAFTRIVDENQDEAWARFYSYCLQNHHASNKDIGLLIAGDESIIGLVKRSNPSIVCPWLTSVDMILQGGPYRGIEFSTSLKSIIEPLNYIFTELMDEEISNNFETKLFEDPSHILDTIGSIVEGFSSKVNVPKLNFVHKSLISAGIDTLCDQLDFTSQAEEYALKVLHESPVKLRSEHNPLESNSGITITFELFKRLVRARMILARDLLVYIKLMHVFSESGIQASLGKYMADLCTGLHTSSKVRRLVDSLRSYAVLVWVAESPIKSRQFQASNEVVNFIAGQFSFFKEAASSQDRHTESTSEAVLRQNLFMNFLIDGGVKFSSFIKSRSEAAGDHTLSNSFYVTDIVLNLCRLLWPKTDHHCLAEYMFTHQLDEHLAKYLDLTEDWLIVGECDRHFLRASNCLLQNRAMQAVESFGRIWMHMTPANLLGRFINLDAEKTNILFEDKVVVDPSLIYRYYEKLIQLFQVNNNPQCIVMLINQCLSLLDGAADADQQHWVNCLRAKLFQYYLELEEPDEAYHIMVMTTEDSLRINCLRKFIVSHCEKEQWSNLLSYPYIDIKNDFIDILNQKAESSDLSRLNGSDFYKTTYYDLLFASYISDDEFRRAADIMYNYAQRLAHEVPGIISIRKQADCLLVALNALRCVPEKAFIEFGAPISRDELRSTVNKRSYDCESEISSRSELKNNETVLNTSIVNCDDIKLKYELTVARLRLLEKDKTAYAIALSPLKPEETIAQLVAASMFSTAMDLALLFKAPMEPIMEGLAAKYIFTLRLSTVDIAMHQDLERGLSDVFTSSYSCIDTYNYISNASCSLVDKLWRLIDFYLVTYDGVSHRYSNRSFIGTFPCSTVLMRTVAAKLLSSGYDIPASLKRMYLSRNSAELLKLLIKYDKLVDAADLAIEMVDRILEPSHSFTFTSPTTTGDPPPVYLPTHLIILLISYLKEDATNKLQMKTGDILIEKLDRFRRSLES